MNTRAIIYADVSPNVVDGSSIWLMSMSEVLSRIFDEVTVILKMAPESDVLIGALASKTNINLDFPSSGELDVRMATKRAEELLKLSKVDLVLVRGVDACNTFCLSPLISPLLWSYLTDLPFPPSKMSKNGKNRIARIAARSRGLFAQTESARSFLESMAVNAPGKTYLLPPMLPDGAYSSPATAEAEEADAGRSLEIIYAGKFAREWKTLELLELPFMLEKMGIGARLTVLGSKINRDKRDPFWRKRMAEALAEASKATHPNLRVLGAVSREESLRLISSSDIGIGWRTQDLDSSLEISTKALEYSACRAAPVVNWNNDHIELFGYDYPLFVSSSATVEDLARLIADNVDRIRDASERAHAAVGEFSMSSAVLRLQKVFTRNQVAARLPGGSQRQRRVVVASHDLKFAGELINYLNGHPGVELRIDNWESLRNHDEKKSRELAAWADVVFCEFAGPNLVFYSNSVPESTPVYARLHGFEVRNRAKWFSNLKVSAVAGIITVSERYKIATEEFLPHLRGKVFTIPNIVDTSDLHRPKDRDSRFHLGLIGMVPFLKRPDRALDLMERLLREDDRYVLHFKGRMPWDYPYVWNDNEQRYSYLDFFERVHSSSLLSRKVVFDPFSPDIGSWLRGIGFVLSPSEEESFHLAPAEGMASGAVPIVWQRPGAAEIFGDNYVFEDLDAMARSILDLRNPQSYLQQSEKSISAAQRWDSDVVMKKWDVVFGLETVLRVGERL